MKMRSAIVLGFITFASPSIAQVNGQTCIDLARTVATGLTFEFSNAEIDALKHYANCRSSQATAGGNLDITYEAFGLGAKYDETKKQAECTKDEQQLGISNTQLRTSQVVFEQGLATVDLCLEKASRSWSIAARQISKDSVSVSVANLSASGADLAGIDIIPENSLTCPGIPTQFPVRLTSVNYLSLTCYRTVTNQTVDGVTVSSAPDATLNLRLADGPFPISLKGYNSSPLDDVRKEITTVRADVLNHLTQIQKELSQVQSSIYGGSDTPILAPNNVCPPGTYAVSLTSESRSGGCCGYLGSVAIICKPLRFDRPAN